MRCHTPEKEVRYLRNYSLSIRNKILNESKANNYIQKLRNILKIKENKYKSVNKLLNSTIISCDEDKIKQSLEIDAHIERMNFLQMITEDNLIDLLSKGNDIRSEGISWIVRKLLQLEYLQKEKTFRNIMMIDRVNL